MSEIILKLLFFFYTYKISDVKRGRGIEIGSVIRVTVEKNDGKAISVELGTAGVKGIKYRRGGRGMANVGVEGRNKNILHGPGHHHTTRGSQKKLRYAFVRRRARRITSNTSYYD